MRLFTFKGGIKLKTCKTPSVPLPIATAPLPPLLIVPLHQNIGGASLPLVKAGDQVLKGQRIGAADEWESSAVHAPTSGTVRAVEPRLAAHPSGLSTLSVVIEPDGRDLWIDRQSLDYTGMAPHNVREILRDSGVVGLGGAAFPCDAKRSPMKPVAIDELVINGAECEPFISCDDLLMRERAEDIVRGITLFRDLLEAKKVLIGIEENKPEAIAAMRDAVEKLGGGFTVVAVPTRYPSGGSRQLIRVLTGKEIPASRHAPEMGVQCFNVATAYTAWRALAHGEPVISRIITLTGNVAEARNWEVRLGTPLKDFASLGTPKPDTDRYLMGGPMRGFEIPGPDTPMVKASNGIIAGSPALFPPPPPEMPCIRCASCAEVCPQELQPFELYRFSRSRNFDRAQQYHLFDCIECASCSYVCPANIPLLQYFRFAKGEIQAREQAKSQADAAKSRYEFRLAREAREKAEKAERLAHAVAEKAAAAQSISAAASTASASDPEAAKKAAIAAAMERARQKREAAAERHHHER